MDKRSNSGSAWSATVILLPLLLFFLPCMLALLGGNDEPMEWKIVIIVMASLYAAVFCVNYFWIVPATMIKENNKALFILSNIIVIFAACSFIPIWFETHGGIPQPGPKAINHDLTFSQYVLSYLRVSLRDVITMIFSVALACALRLSRQQEKLRRRELQLESERHNIELKSLKAQLNPHFLFNAINNIYSLMAVSSDRAQKALHEFSGLLRFLIYDASSLYVPLEKEISFIKNYVELMKLRMSQSIRLDFDISEKYADGLVVAPLLLLTIVENAFKHVGRDNYQSFISIRLAVDDMWLVCSVRNSCSSTETPQTSHGMTESGVGQTNVESQLRLLYPDSHQFDYGKRNDVYNAEIRIMRCALKASFLSHANVSNINKV